MEHQSKFITNPISTEICNLYTTRKSKFYIHTYDPTNILKNIEEYNNPLLDQSIKIKYLDNLREKFDLRIKLNCCNCISFILYYLTDEKKLLDYLFSLKTSVENMSKYLSEPKYNFIARIYLDQSVINFYKTKKDGEIKKIIAFLFAHERVEIFSYNCKSYENNKQITRSLRLLTLFDAEVNIKIIREADGFVSYLDCMNIKNFCLSNKILFMYKLNDTDLNTILDKEEKTINQYISKLEEESLSKCYSPWLNIYLDIINLDSDLPIKPLLDLYAGLIAVSLQFKPEYLNSTITKININLNKKYQISQKNMNILQLYLDQLTDEKIKELLDNDFDIFYRKFLEICNKYNTNYKSYLTIKIKNEEVQKKLRNILSSLLRFKSSIESGMIMKLEYIHTESKIFNEELWFILEKALKKIIQQFETAINILLLENILIFTSFNIFINYFYINLENNYRYCFIINLLYSAIEDKLDYFYPLHMEIINYEKYKDENNYIFFYIIPNISDFINLIFEYFNIFSDAPNKITDFRKEIIISKYKNKYLINLNKFIFKFNIDTNTEVNARLNLYIYICNYINELPIKYYLLQKKMQEFMFGFDEILLLELFNNITSFEKNVKNNLNTYKFYLNSFMTNKIVNINYKRDFNLTATTHDEMMKNKKELNEIEKILFAILYEKYLQSIKNDSKNIIIYDYENKKNGIYTYSVNLLNMFINKLDKYFIDIIFNKKEIIFNEFNKNLLRYNIQIDEKNFKLPFYGLFSIIESSRGVSSFKKKYIKYKKKYLSLTF